VYASLISTRRKSCLSCATLVVSGGRIVPQYRLSLHMHLHPVRLTVEKYLCPYCAPSTMLTSDMVPRKLENPTSHLYHTSIYSLRASDGPNTFVTFSFTALQPLLLSSHASRSLPGPEQPVRSSFFCSTDHEYCITWLAEQFVSASWTLNLPYKHLH